MARFDGQAMHPGTPADLHQQAVYGREECLVGDRRGEMFSSGRGQTKSVSSLDFNEWRNTMMCKTLVKHYGACLGLHQWFPGGGDSTCRAREVKQIVPLRREDAGGWLVKRALWTFAV